MRCDSSWVSPQDIDCGDGSALLMHCNCFVILLSSGEGMLPGTSSFLNSPSHPLDEPAGWLDHNLPCLREGDEE